MITTTLPVVAPAGTGTVMLPSLQLVGLPSTPLNITAPLAPKPEPVMVTVVPTGPTAGETPVMLCGPLTVKFKQLEVPDPSTSAPSPPPRAANRNPPLRACHTEPFYMPILSQWLAAIHSHPRRT